MNPFKELATNIAKYVSDLRARLNPQLQGLPPLEQIEASSVALNIIRSAMWAADDANRMAEAYDLSAEKIEKMFGDVKAEIEAKAITDAITAGTIIRKEDHDNLLAAAKDTGKQEAQNEFAEEKRKSVLAAERREKVKAKLGEVMAAAVTDEVLLGDKWEDVIAAGELRLAKLTEIKLTADGGRPEAFKSLASIPLTAEGATEFDSRFPAYKELMANAPAPVVPAATATAASKGAVPPIQTGNEDGSKKKHLV